MRRDFPRASWQTNFDAMARKTVLKYALNHYGLLSVEMMDAIKNDQSVQENFDAKSEYVDNPENDSEEAVKTEEDKHESPAAKDAEDAPYDEVPDDVMEELNSLADFDGAEEF